MTKREYQEWLNELARSEDADLREIGAHAKQASWYLDTVARMDDGGTPLEALKKQSDQFEEYTEEDFEDCLRGGWCRVFGRYITTWEDGLL